MGRHTHMKLTLKVTRTAVCSSTDDETSLTCPPPESQCQSLSMPGGSFSLLQSKQQWQSHSRFALVPSCRGSAYSARRTCISCGQLCGFAPFSAFLGVVWAYANGVNFFSSVAHITQWVNSVQVVSGIMSQQAGG